MAVQDLKHASVLVVDDRAPARKLVANTLQTIGVGIVNAVPHGAAAIEYLEHSVLGSMHGSTPPVDLIISEWDMEPVNGAMLVNWVRRSAKSPDRFTRIVIMSGALDVEQVEAARALGVNAIFAKPFTVNSLSKHVLSLLADNPPFFKTQGYFGPDRRRRSADAILDERRILAHPHHEVLGRGANIHVGCFDLPHYMMRILAGEDRFRVDLCQRHAAHQTLLPLSEDYTDWIKGDVDVLRLALRIAHKMPDLRARHMAVMHGIAQRLAQEANYFDYPLAAAFSHTLKTVLEADQRLWRGTVGICNTAIHGLEAVLRGKVSGQGGGVGLALRDSLTEMDGKISTLKPQRAYRRGMTF